MGLLYIAEPGVGLYHRTGRLEVIKEGKVLSSLPETLVESIVCLGQVHLSAAAIHFCLLTGIDVSFLRPNGAYLGRLTGKTSSTALLRRLQVEMSGDPHFRLRLACRIISGKVANQRRLLARQRWNGRDSEDSSLPTLANLSDSALKASSSQSLRGIEGAASAAYFSALRKLVPEGISFNSRSRRPPLDPFNSLLSLFYSLLMADVSAALESAGLDLYVGFFHTDRPGRPALALDLMEEFRAPACDRVALSCCNLRLVRPDDFVTSEDGGVTLKPASLKKVIARYADSMIRPTGNGTGNLRTAIYKQVKCLVSSLRGDQYTPYRYT